MIDWKPIEELTEDILKSMDYILLSYDNNQYKLGMVGIDFRNDVFIVVDDFANDEYFSTIQKEYTHYALLTPPQTNQS